MFTTVNRYRLKRNYFSIPLIILLLVSCELVDTPITPDKTIPTRNVRYLVQMTSSSANSNPKISYTDVYGGITELSALTLDLTVAVDSGITAVLSASCNGYYSALTGNSSAVVDIKLYVADSLAADSIMIASDNLLSVSASAYVSAKVE